MNIHNIAVKCALPPLTKRQREVLNLIGKGYSNKEIARALGIAEATVKVHVAATLRVINARNRTEAAFKVARSLDSVEQLQ